MNYLRSGLKAVKSIIPGLNNTETSSNVAEPASFGAEPASNVGEPASNVGEPASNFAKQASFGAEPASNIAEPASNVGEPASNVGEPASNFAKQASFGAEPASNVGETASNVGETASNVAEPASNVTEAASKFGETASNVSEPASNVAEPASNVGEPASNFAEPASFGAEPAEPTEPKRLADAVKEKSKKLRMGPLEVYAVPLKEEHVSTEGWKCFSFGTKSTIPNRTIMVLGATGAGKSTLINRMINYILGVKWEDSYRFMLVDEDRSKSQAHSQTSEVTAYKIYHQQGSQIDYTLTIVDTPGFGDTRGIDRDREITEQIHNIFTAANGVADVDAVCFVAQASLARLTPSQRYVFDSILSIFGKDVAENIRILVTFADGQKPPALEAINESGVPCPKDKAGSPLHFKFNNSSLFADNKPSAAGSMGGDDSDEDENFDLMFWKMGTKSMKRFFTDLTHMETKSLTLTKEVLRERKELEVSVEGLQKQVRLGLSKMEEIKQTRQILKNHEAEISRNEKFQFEVTVTKPFKENISGTGNYITNCQQCHYTCHYPCQIPNDEDKAGCAAMTNGYCRVCPGKCVWSVHFNQKYRWNYKEVNVKRTVEELKEKYVKAKGEKMTVQQLMDELKAEYGDVQREVVRLMQKSTKCLNRLKEIALKPNPLSTPEYIDLLIEGEKSEAKPGWTERTKSLMKMKEKAELTARVERGEDPLHGSCSGLQQNDPKEMDEKDSKLETLNQTETK